MRLLLLNQFGSGSGAPTGRILSELGSALEQSGHEVILLSSDTTYGTPRRGRARIFRELVSHTVLFQKGLWHRKVDAVISLTSPTCLAVTAGLLAAVHRARHFHWAMDLYPEVAVRLGELHNQNIVQILQSLMRRAYRGAHRVVALDDDMKDHLEFHYGIQPSVIEPFAPEIAWPAAVETRRPGRRWLYSGNFGRAHEIEALLRVQSLLEARGVKAQLILQGQGPQFISSQVTAAGNGLRSVEWRAPVPETALGESLAQADVLVVTRKPEMKGLLLPSKLVLAELSGRPILWIGDTDGKTAQRLAQSGRHGVFAIDAVEPIADWLQQLFERESPPAAVAPKDTRLSRLESIRRWDLLLSQ